MSDNPAEPDFRKAFSKMLADRATKYSTTLKAMFTCESMKITIRHKYQHCVARPLTVEAVANTLHTDVHFVMLSFERFKLFPRGLLQFPDKRPLDSSPSSQSSHAILFNTQSARLKEIAVPHLMLSDWLSIFIKCVLLDASKTFYLVLECEL